MPEILPPTPEREEPEHPGFQIVRWLRPFGSGLVILIFILFLVYALSTGREPIRGYAPPHDGAYYARHLDELASELNDTVLPLVDPAASAEVTEDTVTVSIPENSYVQTRAAVLRYFDSDLLTFREHSFKRKE